MGFRQPKQVLNHTSWEYHENIIRTIVVIFLIMVINENLHKEVLPTQLSWFMTPITWVCTSNQLGKVRNHAIRGAGPPQALYTFGYNRNMVVQCGSMWFNVVQWDILSWIFCKFCKQVGGNILIMANRCQQWAKHQEFNHQQ